MPPAVVLVTGVSRWLGGALAAELAADPSVERVLGVDTVTPGPEALRRLGRTEFVRADIRNPLIGKVIAAAGVDTVVHMNISSTPGERRPHVDEGAQRHRHDAAAGRLPAGALGPPPGPQVDQRRLRGQPRDPAVFTETMQARRVPGGGFAKDSLDIEGYVRSFARRRPEVGVAVLRFTNFIGPRIDSLLTGFLRMPVVPTALGFDARVQLLHEDDAVAVLVKATTGDFAGTVNVGAGGTVLLSQAIRRLGRVPLPLPEQAMAPLGRLTRQARITDYSPEQLRFLNFGRVVDTRVLREEFGYTPRYTTAQALADYGRTVVPVVDRDVVGSVVQTAEATVGRLASVWSSLSQRSAPTPVGGLRAVRDA
ncbi:NAD-dependent epimerase/dehydratase family protein [Klenkia terrae]